MYTPVSIPNHDRGLQGESKLGFMIKPRDPDPPLLQSKNIYDKVEGYSSILLFIVQAVVHARLSKSGHVQITILISLFCFDFKFTSAMEIVHQLSKPGQL